EIMNLVVGDSWGSVSRLGFSTDFGSLGYVAMSILLSENSGFAVTPLGLIRSLSKLCSVEFLPASSVHFTVPSLSPHIPAYAGDTNNATPIRSCLNIEGSPLEVTHARTLRRNYQTVKLLLGRICPSMT